MSDYSDSFHDEDAVDDEYSSVEHVNAAKKSPSHSPRSGAESSYNSRTSSRSPSPPHTDSNVPSPQRHDASPARDESIATDEDVEEEYHSPGAARSAAVPAAKLTSRPNNRNDDVEIFVGKAPKSQVRHVASTITHTSSTATSKNSWHDKSEGDTHQPVVAAPRLVQQTAAVPRLRENSERAVAASEGTPRRASVGRVRAEVLDSSDDDNGSAAPKPLSNPRSDKKPQPVANLVLEAKLAPVKKQLPVPASSAPPERKQPVTRSLQPAPAVQRQASSQPMSKELLRLIEQRDNLRRVIADLKITMEEDSSSHVVKKERARRQYISSLELENQVLAAEVDKLRGDLDSNGLHDRLKHLAREISAREAELKAIERERRSIGEEIKLLEKTAAPSDDVSLTDEQYFVKRQEELVASHEATRIRHKKQMEDLALALERIRKATEASESKAKRIRETVERDQVADMDNTEYTELQRQFEKNAKTIKNLKQSLVALAHEYETPSIQFEWQDKRFEEEKTNLEIRIQQILKAIKQKEDQIAANYNLTERPSYFIDPAVPERLPERGESIKPPPIVRAPRPPAPRPANAVEPASAKLAKGHKALQPTPEAATATCDEQPKQMKRPPPRAKKHQPSASSQLDDAGTAAAAPAHVAKPKLKPSAKKEDSNVKSHNAVVDPAGPQPSRSTPVAAGTPHTPTPPILSSQPSSRRSAASSRNSRRSEEVKQSSSPAGEEPLYQDEKFEEEEVTALPNDEEKHRGTDSEECSQVTGAEEQTLTEAAAVSRSNQEQQIGAYVEAYDYDDDSDVLPNPPNLEIIGRPIPRAPAAAAEPSAPPQVAKASPEPPAWLMDDG